jgi:hypothetical protein
MLWFCTRNKVQFKCTNVKEKGKGMFWESPKSVNYEEFVEFVKSLEGYQEIENESVEREGILDPPEIDDLYYLYKNVRENYVVSILEFGSGYSTLILTLALYQNYIQFGKSYLEKCVHPNPFKILTVDASRYFLEKTLNRIPPNLKKFVMPHYSEVELFEFGGPGGQIANRWKDLPNFTPDLIYIDGPDTEQFEATLNGYVPGTLSLPMSADILSREFFYWSGTNIILDGRGANAEFLRLNLRRNWQYSKDNYGDRHYFHLTSEPWGYFTNIHINFKLNMSQVNLPWVHSRRKYLAKYENIMKK